MGGANRAVSPAVKGAASFASAIRDPFDTTRPQFEGLLQRLVLGAVLAFAFMRKRRQPFPSSRPTEVIATKQRQPKVNRCLTTVSVAGRPLWLGRGGGSLGRGASLREAGRPLSTTVRAGAMVVRTTTATEADPQLSEPSGYTADL
jgi:hypothetical protein